MSSLKLRIIAHDRDELIQTLSVFKQANNYFCGSDCNHNACGIPLGSVLS